MELKILTLLCVATFCKYADATITKWTVTGNSPVNSAMATDQEGSSLAENVATNSETPISAVAETDQASITYNTGEQTPQNPANLLTVDTDGLISVGATALDYDDDYTEIIVEIVATDDNDATGTATVTFPITGINDNTPKFEEESYVENIRSGACTGTDVFMHEATDEDREGGDKELVYTIASGNKDDMFTISASTGQVKVATDKTVRHDEHDRYDLVIMAKDNGVTPSKLSGTTKVALYVCGATSISLSLATLLVALLASLR